MKKAKRRITPIILFALFIVYLIVLSKITIFRDANAGSRNVNIIPFTTICEYLLSILRGNKIIGLSNILGNIIIFFPLGYMTALLLPKMRKAKRIFMLSAAFSLVIETFQYVFARGRADIDDVILNILGGVAGYVAYILTSKLIKPKKYAVIICAAMIAATGAGFIVVDNYKFLLPMPGNPTAYAETLNNFNEPIVANNTQSVNNVNNVGLGADSTDTLQNKTDDAAWNLILVNRWNLIPDDCEIDLTELANGQLVDKRIYPALQDIFDAARSDGVYPVVVSGYRTADTQQRLLNEKTAEYRASGYSAADAKTKAESWVAIPGTSEHQLGIAVDINADGIHSAGYEVYDWLERNAYKYGFICRYPPDKAEITGVIGEAWHYRYVGIEAATEIYNQGVCLEEYLNSTN